MVFGSTKLLLVIIRSSCYRHHPYPNSCLYDCIEPLRSLQKTMSQLGENQEILQKELDEQKSITDKVILSR
jgi:hypothetical protein